MLCLDEVGLLISALAGEAVPNVVRERQGDNLLSLGSIEGPCIVLANTLIAILAQIDSGILVVGNFLCLALIEENVVERYFGICHATTHEGNDVVVEGVVALNAAYSSLILEFP